MILNKLVPSAPTESTTTLFTNSPDKIYPYLKTEGEVEEMVRTKINYKNIDPVITAVKNKSDKLNHYSKIVKRWNRANDNLTTIYIILRTILQITTITLGLLIDKEVIPNTIATEVIDIFSVFVLIPLGILTAKICSRNVKKYKNISYGIENCINKVYVYWKQATEDEVITEEELSKFKSIFDSSDIEIKAEEEKPVFDNEVVKTIEENLLALISTLKSKK